MIAVPTVTLRPYAPADAGTLVPFVQSFFRTHHRDITEGEALSSLGAWSSPDHRLYVIEAEQTPAGFLHLQQRGPTVCWVEDIFVAEALRGRGIASAALSQAEDLVRDAGLEALCMDVVPDNLPALRLYHRLGYDRLSLVTVRKDFAPFDTARTEQIAGLPFRVKQF